MAAMGKDTAPIVKERICNSNKIQGTLLKESKIIVVIFHETEKRKMSKHNMDVIIFKLSERKQSNYFIVFLNLGVL